jgi:hypothetical protein|tara:strand:- start:8 stop:163 length:156 start_codon:yes stop_codon:yes gene_type:complete
MNLTDLKIYSLNFGALALSLTEIELILKVAVLAITAGYTVHKWYLIYKKNK